MSREPMMIEAVATWYDGITRGRTDRQIVGAVVDVAVAARDAEWRAAVAEMRSVYSNVPESDYATGWHEACDAIVRHERVK